MNTICTNTLCELNLVRPDELEKMINLGYLKSIELAKSHYENFPVISKFLPKELRKHVAVVYQFARIADDIADEGTLLQEERLNQLDLYWNKLDSCLHGELSDEFWAALHNTVTVYNLTHQNFYNLLLAFKQDVVKNTFRSFFQIEEYCSLSANPVGRIILELFNIRDEKAFNYSDKICTALQLANFYQDISIDIKKGRIYIPLDELQKFNVQRDKYLLGEASGDFKGLLKFQVERCEKLFYEGSNLLKSLPLRLKIQIKLTILGGLSILAKIKNNDYNALNIRPVLGKKDLIIILIKSFIGGNHRSS